MTMDTNILLESGTNELELLEFEVGDSCFGINISKVIEIMMDQEVTPVPNSPDEVEGVFIPRDKLISVIDLHKVVKKDRPTTSKNIFVICEFNQMQVAFRVSRVKGIQRISWSEISDPPSIANGSGGDAVGLSTGVAKLGNRIIIILDFEKIVSMLNKDAGLNTQGLDKLRRPDRITSRKKLVIADDSRFLNKMIVDSLEKIGFTNVESFSNGQDAYDYISSFRSRGSQITNDIACIISDIEMPKMDGHRLTKLVKDDDVLKQIPVILFSSLINDQMILKGKSVGADAQFSKPQITELISYLIDLLA